MATSGSATLDSMKPKAPKAAKTAPAKVEEKPVEAPPAIVGFNWDALPEAKPVEYTRGPLVSRIDIEAETPAAIKARINESYEAYAKAYEDTPTDEAEARAVSNANIAANRRQKLNTPEQAEAFVKLAKRYAAFKGMTLRGGIDPKDSTVVVFRAKPKETRQRKAA